MIQCKEDRIAELDIIKALGIFFMIFLHMSVWWYTLDDFSAKSPSEKDKEILFFLKAIGFFVFMIPITAGASLYFIVKKWPWKKIWPRSVLLLVLGYAINVLAFGIEDIFAWDILQFIAMSTIVLFAISKMRPYAAEILIVFFVVVAQFVAVLNIRGDDFGYIGIVILGDGSGDNYWAFFPWFLLVFFGYLLVQWHERKLISDPFWRKAILLCCVAVVTISVYLDEFIISVDLDNIWGPDIFMPSLLKVLGIVSFFILLFYFLKSLRIKDVAKASLVEAYSRGILWIYLSHLIIGFHLVRILRMNGFFELRYLLLSIVGMWILHYYVGLLAIRLKKGVKTQGELNG